MVSHFIDAVEQMPDTVSEFSTELWAMLIDQVTVYVKKDIRFSLNDSPDFTIQSDKKTRDGEKYNSTEFLLEPGEKTTFAFTAKGPKESGETDFSVYVQFYNSVGILSELEVNYDLHKTDIK